MIKQVTPIEALEYGWSIIPMTAEKHPMCKILPYYEESIPPADADDIIEWLDNPSTQYFAVITGKTWGFFILDFDVKDGEIGLETLQSLGLLNKAHVRTRSGGYHVYIQHPGWYVPTRNAKSTRELGKVFPAMDIKGDRGYALFWARVDAEGKYTWLRDFDPVSWSEFQQCPRFDQLLPFLQKAPEPELVLPATFALKDHPPGAIRSAAERFVRTAVSRAENRPRHTTGFGLACRLRDLQLSVTEAESYMRQFQSAAVKGQRSYPWDEALKTLQQAYAKPRGLNPLDKQRLSEHREREAKEQAIKEILRQHKTRTNG